MNQKWEYLFIEAAPADLSWKPRFSNGQELRSWQNGPDLYKYANTLGEQGWELTATQRPDTRRWWFVFKRSTPQ